VFSAAPVFDRSMSLGALSLAIPFFSFLLSTAAMMQLGR